MALNLRELAESDKVVVIGSSLLLQLLDRLDTLEKVAEAARPLVGPDHTGNPADYAALDDALRDLDEVPA